MLLISISNLYVFLSLKKKKKKKLYVFGNNKQ